MSAPRRIVTGHDPSGKSVVLSDDRPVRTPPPLNGVIVRFTDGPLRFFDQILG
jgi:hypothetical protein